MDEYRLYSEKFRQLPPHVVQQAYRNLFELYQRALKSKKIYQKAFRVSQEETVITSTGTVKLFLVGYKGHGEILNGKGSFNGTQTGERRGVPFYEITAIALLKWNQKSQSLEPTLTLTTACSDAVTKMKGKTGGVKVERVFGELRFEHPTPKVPHPAQLRRADHCIIFSVTKPTVGQSVVEKERPRY